MDHKERAYDWTQRERGRRAGGHHLLIVLAELGVCFACSLVDPPPVIQRKCARLLELRVQQRLVPASHTHAIQRVACFEVEPKRIPRCMRAQLR